MAISYKILEHNNDCFTQSQIETMNYRKHNNKPIEIKVLLMQSSACLSNLRNKIDPISFHVSCSYCTSHPVCVGFSLQIMRPKQLSYFTSNNVFSIQDYLSEWKEKIYYISFLI